MGLKIFFSFSEKDAKRLHIEDIAYSLENFSLIDKVFIYTRDVPSLGEGDIIKYMNKGLEDCDILVVFCTENSMKSDPVFNEWGTSLILGKPIIPVFEETKNIPTIIKKNLGIRINEQKLNESYDDIINELKHKIIGLSNYNENHISKNDNINYLNENYLTDDGILSRQKYDINCNAYYGALQTNIQNIIKEKSPLIGTNNFSHPAATFIKDFEYLDTICTIISRAGEKIMILPSGESNLDIEGVGRTNLLLCLLGLNIKYNHVFGVDTINEKINVNINKNTNISLIASDMAYLGIINNNLCGIPTRGEVVSFIWDIARNIYRSSELNYYKGKHREEGRSKLKNIFFNIDLSGELIRNIYSKLDDYFFINKIYILKRNYGRYIKPPSIKRITDNETMIEKLESSLMVSADHGSNFWSRNKSIIKKKVKDIINNLDISKIDIYEIEITFPGLRLPQYIFDDIQELMEKGKVESDTGKSEIDYLIGISYHNFKVLQNIPDARELHLLVTSGQKFFNDISVWEEIAKGKRKLDFKVLLLDPRSQAAKDRENVAYQEYKKESGFLRKEINENISEVYRMAAYLNQNVPNTNIIVDCKLYTEKPIFRMTFIDDTLLLSTYSDIRRTGNKTKFYVIEKEKHEELFLAFKTEYMRIFKRASPRNG